MRYACNVLQLQCVYGWFCRYKEANSSKNRTIFQWQCIDAVITIVYIHNMYWIKQNLWKKTVYICTRTEMLDILCFIEMSVLLICTMLITAWAPTKLTLASWHLDELFGIINIMITTVISFLCRTSDESLIPEIVHTS